MNVMEPKAENQASPQSQESLSFEEAGNRLRAFIEGEPLGSVISKAFCDFVDEQAFLQAYTRAKPSTPHGEEDRRFYSMSLIAMNETIRQRSNELPGYMQTRDDVNKLHSDILFATPTEGQDPKTNPTDRANYFMADLKRDYLDGKLTSPNPASSNS